MNTSGEAADQVVKMMLEGSEVLIRLTGSGAKNAAVLLYSILREQKKTKGAARLSNMLRSGQALKVYTFKDRDLKKFREVAKEYGVLYTILKHKDKSDGIFDVLIRADDEYKINRIKERFKLSQVDSAELKAEIIKEKSEKTEDADSQEKETDDKDAPELEHPEKSADEIIADQLMGDPAQAERMTPANPTAARTEPEAQSHSISTPSVPTTQTVEGGNSPVRENPSESSSRTISDFENQKGEVIAGRERQSVRKKMEDIKRRRAEEARNPLVPPTVTIDKTPKAKER